MSGDSHFHVWWNYSDKTILFMPIIWTYETEYILIKKYTNIKLTCTERRNERLIILHYRVLFGARKTNLIMEIFTFYPQCIKRGVNLCIVMNDEDYHVWNLFTDSAWEFFFLKSSTCFSHNFEETNSREREGRSVNHYEDCNPTFLSLSCLLKPKWTFFCRSRYFLQTNYPMDNFKTKQSLKR